MSVAGVDLKLSEDYQFTKVASPLHQLMRKEVEHRNAWIYLVNLDFDYDLVLKMVHFQKELNAHAYV